MTISVIYTVRCQGTCRGQGESKREALREALREAKRKGFRRVRVKNGSYWDFCSKCYKVYGWRNMSHIEIERRLRTVQLVRKATYDCSECCLMGWEIYKCTIPVKECNRMMTLLGVAEKDFGRHCFKKKENP